MTGEAKITERGRKKNSFSKHSQTQLMQKAKDLIKSLISAFTCKNNERN